MQRWHLRLAGQLAAGAGHAGMEALALLWLADTYSAVQNSAIAGGPDEVLVILDRADELAGPLAPPALRAHIALRQAEERAMVGAATESEYGMERAESVFAVAVGHDDGGLFGMSWPAATLMPAFRGNVMLLSDRPRAAVSVLEGMGAEMGRGPITNRAAWLTDLAAAYARLGEPERAASLLVAAWELASDAGLEDRRRRVLAVRQSDLGRWGDEPSVRRLDDLMAGA